MTFSTITVDRRKLLVSALGMVSATVVTGLAISASPGACWAPEDPIHEAIASHREAVRVYKIARRAAWVRDGYGDGPSIAAECIALEVACDRVIDTAPTTLSGLKALSDYLAEPWSGGIAAMIRCRMEAAGYVSPPPSRWHESVEIFIANRRARIDAAA
jgi:hypothetical protein